MAKHFSPARISLQPFRRQKNWILRGTIEENVRFFGKKELMFEENEIDSTKWFESLDGVWLNLAGGSGWSKDSTQVSEFATSRKAAFDLPKIVLKRSLQAMGGCA